jgi:hypothetical protein
MFHTGIEVAIGRHLCNIKELLYRNAFLNKMKHLGQTKHDSGEFNTSQVAEVNVSNTHWYVLSIRWQTRFGHRHIHIWVILCWWSKSRNPVFLHRFPSRKSNNQHCARQWLRNAEVFPRKQKEFTWFLKDGRVV